MATENLNHPKNLALPSEVLNPSISTLQAQSNLTHKTNSQHTTIKEFNSFKIANLNLMIQANVSCQVNLQNNVFAMPNARNWLLGVTNFKGNIIPVYSVHHFISGQTNIKLNQCYLLIFEINDSQIGIYVEKLPKKIRFDKSQQANKSLDINPKIMSSIITSYHDSSGEIWFEINPNYFFKKLSEL